MNWQIVGIAITIFFATFSGGIIVFKLRKTLPFFFAFAAGNLIGVSFFDIQPETIVIAQNLGVPLIYVMMLIVLSIFIFSLLERYLQFYHSRNNEAQGQLMGPVSAGGLVIDSFLDGIAIGIAFQVSSSIGLLVGLAVIFHDITDGMNTVTIMLKNNQSSKQAFSFLLMDSFAPFAGIIVTAFVMFPSTVLLALLSIFAGEFIYIGAVSLLPETYRYTPRKMVISMGLGILLILILTLLIS